LGNLMGIPGFAFDSAEAVCNEALQGVDVAARLSNAVSGNSAMRSEHGRGAGLQRIADVPIYFADALVRRSGPLQKTADAAAPVASLSSATAERVGLNAGDKVRITQGGGDALLDVALDDRVPAGCVRVPAAHPLTAALGAMSGEVELERVPAARGVTA
jgi:NADH-quinone oxidoreductase subunit G